MSNFAYKYEIKKILCTEVRLGLHPLITFSLGLLANQSVVLLPHTKSAPATSQTTVLFSYNKSTLATSHSQANIVIVNEILSFVNDEVQY